MSLGYEKMIQDSLALNSVMESNIEIAKRRIDTLETSINNAEQRTRKDIVYILSQKNNELSYSERQLLDILPYKIAEIKIELSGISESLLTKYAAIAEKRKDWQKGLVNTNLNIKPQIKQMPVFYSVSNMGILQFTDNHYLDLREVMANSIPKKDLYYPVFIIEKTGIYHWKSMIEDIERNAMDNNIRIGYEPYTRDLNIIYDVYAIKKP